MDPLRCEQFDRMEHALAQLLEGQELLIEENESEVLEAWYDDVILQPTGALHHLAQDVKVKEYFAQLHTEGEEDDTQDTPAQSDGEDEYRQ